MTKYFERDIADLLETALENMPVVVITGMRQTGKTTLLRSQPGLADRIYVSFDDFAQLEAAKRDPDGFVNRGQSITIDEAHKCPEIFSAIKRQADRERRPGQFLLSGSANFSILKRITESLAGRSIYLALHPFNRREISGQAQAEPFLRNFFNSQQILPFKGSPGVISPEDLTLGGMPTVCLGQIKSPPMWFKGYEQTYLERDVRELSQVDNLIMLRALLRLAALRTGQLLSLSQLGRDAKLNATTTSRYISLFEASFIIERIPPYLGNRSSRLIKSSKMYLSDTGLACHLAGIDPASIQDDPLFGALFETYVAQNLLSILQTRWPEAVLHFWSIQGRHEVDFVIEAGRVCLALEVKSAARWQEKDLSGLKAFLNATPHCKAAILCYNGEDAVKLGQRLWALPVGLVLS